MPKSPRKSRNGKGRRKFLKTMTLGVGTLALPANSVAASGSGGTPTVPPADAKTEAIQYPRIYRGRQREMIGFPLGGVGAGSISLGGRGQLDEWWIFNRPDKGRRPQYAFPAIRVEAANRKPIVEGAGSAHHAALLTRTRATWAPTTYPACRGLKAAPLRANIRWRGSNLKTRNCPCACRWTPLHP